jgi:hypothetical protein
VALVVEVVVGKNHLEMLVLGPWVVVLVVLVVEVVLGKNHLEILVLRMVLVVMAVVVAMAMKRMVATNNNKFW